MIEHIRQLSRTVWEIAGGYYRAGDFWHSQRHILSMFEVLQANFEEFRQEFPLENWTALVFAICYHDSTYIPGQPDNEEKSYGNFVRDFGENPDVKRMILGTKEGTGTEFDPVLHDLDYAYFSDAALFAQAEQGIRNEYMTFMKIPAEVYENGRRAFLRSLAGNDIFITNAMKPYNAAAQRLIAGKL